MPDADDYAWLKAHRICTCCQQNKARHGKITCLECAGKAAERHVKRWDAMPPTQKKSWIARSSAYNKQLREMRRAQGLCTVCGKSPARAGKLECTECAARRRQYEARSRAKKQDDADGTAV